MLQQAIHHSLDILGALLCLCLCAFCLLYADGLPPTSTMQNPIIIQGPGKWEVVEAGMTPIQALQMQPTLSVHTLPQLYLDQRFLARVIL